MAISGLDPIGSTTWGAWVRLPADSHTNGAVISATHEGAGQGHSLGFSSGGTARHPRIIWNHDVSGWASLLSPEPIDEEWNHIALTFDAAAGMLKLFVNGNEVGSVASTSTPFTTVNLGRREASQEWSYKGLVDNVVVYDRALSAQEIGQLAETVPDLTQGMVLRWALDETSGVVASDSSGNGNDGELIGFPDDDSQWVAGAVDGALSVEPAVSGSDDSETAVAISGLDPIGSTTWGAWVRLPSDSHPLGAIISATHDGAGQGHSLGFHTGATARHPRIIWNHDVSGWAIITSPEPIDEEWNHIALTYDADSGTLSLIVNGNEVGSAQSTSTPFTSINLGRREASQEWSYKGLIDDVVIFKRALSLQEIRMLIAVEGAPPFIEQQPRDTTVLVGERIELSVEVTGAEPFEFVWFKDGELIEGAMESNIVIESAQLADSGSYQVVVTNPDGRTPSVVASVDVLEEQVIDPTVPPEGLVLHWPLDETSGATVSDSSGNGNHGELIGFPNDDSEWVAGAVGGALSVQPSAVGSAKTDVAAVVSGLPAMTSTTWGAWVQLPLDPHPLGAVISATLEGAQQGHSLGFHTGATTRHPRIIWNHPLEGWTIITAAEPLDSLWNHLALTFDDASGDLILYVNGEVTASGVSTGAPFTTINLGRREASNEWSFKGTIDDVVVYDRALDLGEVKQLAGARLAGPPRITLQPQSFDALARELALFTVDADGLAPFTYQWSRDGQPIPDATDRTLALENVQEGSAGEYSVEVTNSEGSLTANIATLTVQPAVTVPDLPLSVGLVVHLALDESSGLTALDSSGLGNPGTLIEFPDPASPWVAGQINGGLDVQPPGNIPIEALSQTTVLVPDLPVLASTTWAAWVNMDSELKFPAVISAGHAGASQGHSLGFGEGPSARQPRIQWNHNIDTSVILSPDPVVFGIWNHLAMTYEANSKALVLYVNGREKGRVDSAETSAFDSVNIGLRAVGPVLGFKGMLDDIGIWDRALSPNDIQLVYQNGLASEPLPSFQPLVIERFQAVDDQTKEMTVRTLFPGRTHAALYKNDLGDPEWLEDLDAVFGDISQDGFLTIRVTANELVRFYQVVALPPGAIFQDDFESGAPGWTHGGNGDNWELGKPTTGPGSAVSGENVYATGLDSDFAPSSNSFLLSPAIDLTGLNRASLSFWEFRNVFPNLVFHGTTVNVLDAETNEFLGEIMRSASPTAGWEQQRLRLPPNALNKSVFLEFVLYSDPFDLSEGWFIDDVVVLPE